MKKNKPKYLSLYYEWMKNEQMGSDSLCNFFTDAECNELPQYKEFTFIKPTTRDHNRNRNDPDFNWVYWGSGQEQALRWQFTPLRQTLVLLMAALNNEL